MSIIEKALNKTVAKHIAGEFLVASSPYNHNTLQVVFIE